MFLLDTDVVSEMRRSRPHGAVAAWLQSTDQRLLRLSAFSPGEIQAGIELTRSQDPGRAAELDRWADEVERSYEKPDTLADDARIAATAVVHRLVVVTRNVRDFQPFKVQTFNPFAAGS